MGTGTGILALAAARRGAKVLAIDVDPEAVAAALENVRLNALEDLIWVESTPLNTLRQQFALILANLTAADLAHWAEALAGRTLAGGLLIVSGFAHRRPAHRGSPLCPLRPHRSRPPHPGRMERIDFTEGVSVFWEGPGAAAPCPPPKPPSQPFECMVQARPCLSLDHKFPRLKGLGVGGQGSFTPPPRNKTSGVFWRRRSGGRRVRWCWTGRRPTT